MADIVLYLIGFVIVLGFLVLVLVVPIIALVRSRGLGELRRRLDDLEDDMRRLRRLVRRRPGAEAPAVEPEPEAEAARPVTEQEPVVVMPVDRPRRRGPLFQPPTAASLEEWIGRRGLGWAAVVLLLFATAFFLKYAFENDWIGPLGRVSIGLIAGAGLCVAGWRFHRRAYPIFSQMLTAAGIVLLYLATFASFGYYHLMPRQQAALFLILLVAEAAALALVYDAMAIALMAVVGGLLTPILLHADQDQYRSLFAYLVVLNLGAVSLALFRAWRAVATVALAGTQALFWAWWAENYHPEKLQAALLFQSAIFALFLVDNVLAHVVRRRNADIEALIRTVLNAFLFFLAGYVLLRDDYRIWLGTAAVGLAIVYTALARVVLRRRPDDTWHQLVVVATALGLVAMVFPLQADAAWIALGWSVEGLALSWFGLRIRSDRLAPGGGPAPPRGRTPAVRGYRPAGSDRAVPADPQCLRPAGAGGSGVRSGGGPGVAPPPGPAPRHRPCCPHCRRAGGRLPGLADPVARHVPVLHDPAGIGDGRGAPGARGHDQPVDPVARLRGRPAVPRLQAGKPGAALDGPGPVRLDAMQGRLCGYGGAAGVLSGGGILRSVGHHGGGGVGLPEAGAACTASPRPRRRVMRRRDTMALAVLLGLTAPLAAQAPATGTEALSAWEWYADLPAPAAGAPFADFVLPPAVFDGARADLADLRLYDAAHAEVPYALRIRHKEDVHQRLNATEFNRATNPDRSADVSLDLGPNPAQHNEIEVATPGKEFRRPLRVEGSDDGKAWSTLLDKVYLIHFEDDGHVVDIRRFKYTPSRFRYLRVHVSPYAAVPNDAPTIQSAAVLHEVREPGDYVTLPALVDLRQPVRGDDGQPASAWFIRFTDNNELAPCESLTLDVAENEFVRPYRLETYDPGGTPQVIASGTLHREPADQGKPLVLSFPEATARRLRLVVTDQRNPPLSLTGVQYTAAARRVIFRPTGAAGSLRLYFGNAGARPPGYEFARLLPEKIDPPPADSTLGPRQKNPNYRAPPKPWTERYPWLVYVVLGAASLVLLGLLGLLGREAIARHGVG